MRPLPHLVLWSLGLLRAETQTTDRERARLAAHAAGRSRIVEIGVWHGVTTSVLRRAMARDGELWAVDPFPPGQLGFSLQRVVARREVGRVRNGSVRWIRTTGVRAATLYERERQPPAGLVFIDGDHSFQALSSDWTAWSHLVAHGGIVGLHDSRSTPDRPIDDAGSVRATKQLVLPDPRFELVEAVDSLTILRRL
jgi:predicted O-methyltransferase YrrM